MNPAPALRPLPAIAALSLALLAPASAVIITDSATFGPNVAIPDGSTAGVADSRMLLSQIALITQVRVSLAIAGTPGAGDAFNGDYFVTLTHGSGFAVLLNRAGRTASDPFGYGDSGFDVTFDDAGAAPDIHNYQLTLNPGGGTLTGTWGSNGRNVNPNAVLDTTPQTAQLDSFNGLGASGEWTLFVADLESLGTGRLVGWTLEVTGQRAESVPEGGSSLVDALAVAAGLAATGRRLRRRPATQHAHQAGDPGKR